MYYMSSFFTNAVQFADQYLELTTSLPDNHNIYGLGEHVTPNLKLRLNKALWIVDTWIASSKKIGCKSLQLLTILQNRFRLWEKWLLDDLKELVTTILK